MVFTTQANDAEVLTPELTCYTSGHKHYF